MFRLANLYFMTAHLNPNVVVGRYCLEKLVFYAVLWNRNRICFAVLDPDPDPYWEWNENLNPDPGKWKLTKIYK